MFQTQNEFNCLDFKNLCTTSINDLLIIVYIIILANIDSLLDAKKKLLDSIRCDNEMIYQENLIK